MDSAGKAQSVTPHVELTPAWDDEIEYQRLAEACTLSRTGQPSKAREIALAMLEIAEHNDDPRLKARCSIDIAWYSFQLGQAEQAYSYAYRAVEFWKNQNSPRDEAEARSIAGWLLLELWHVEEATEEVMQALALAETCGDVQIHCLALNVVGLMFRATKQPKESIDFCRRAVVLARDIGDPVLLGRWLINLGCAHALAARCSSKVNASFSAAEFKIALALLDEAVALAHQEGDTWAARICLANSAEYLLELQDFSAAEQCLLRYWGIEGEQTSRNEAHFLYTLGQTLVALERLDEAGAVLQQCVILSEKNSNLEALMYAYFYLSQVHERSGDTRAALAFHKKFHETYLRVTTEQAQQRERLATAIYENKKLRDLAQAETERARQIAESYAELKLDSERMAAASYVDPLTGLHNRRHLELMLPGLHATDVVSTVAMIDIDYFKDINDRFSHIVGDQVLAQVGELIRRSKRECDEAIRFGGEEFLLIVRGLSAATASQYVDGFRLTISGWNWDVIAVGLSVTVSIGASDTQEASTPTQAISRADHRLYVAKQRGRNKLVSTD